MRATTLVLVALCLAVAGFAQSTCQQRCDNTYNICNTYAYQQFNNCLATAAAGFSCIQCSGAGCPNVTPSDCNQPQAQSYSCCQSYNQKVAQCNSNYDLATSVCDFNYANCSTDCGGQVPGNNGRAQPMKRPQNRAHDAYWNLAMRNLSRPEKLQMPL